MEIDPDSTFLLSASGSIYSGQSYVIVAGVFNSSLICSCTVFLTGPGLNMTTDINLTPLYPLSNYTFQLPELEKGDYYLSVIGTDGIQHKSTRKLDFNNLKNFIKIQIPKSNYRPRELLQFRVIFHNEFMVSSQPEDDAIIWIADSKNNIVRLYKKLEVIKGVFKSQIVLGRYPNLGLWKICAKNGEGLIPTCASVHVWNYELPNFDIRLESPNIVYSNDHEIAVTVYAKYPIDIPVNGSVELELKQHCKIGNKTWIQKVNGTLKNGECSFSVPLPPLNSRISNSKESKLKLTATVTEIIEERLETYSKIVTLTTDANDPVLDDESMSARTAPDKYLLRKLQHNK